MYAVVMKCSAVRELVDTDPFGEAEYVRCDFIQLEKNDLPGNQDDLVVRLPRGQIKAGDKVRVTVEPYSD